MKDGMIVRREKVDGNGTRFKQQAEHRYPNQTTKQRMTTLCIEEACVHEICPDDIAVSVMPEATFLIDTLLIQVLRGHAHFLCIQKTKHILSSSIIRNQLNDLTNSNSLTLLPLAY